MLFRALFWISLVAVLMPREPDLGFGRPGMAGMLGKDLSLPQALANPSQVCSGHEATCSSALSALDWLQANAVQSLDTVKAEIEQQQRDRARGLN